MTNLGTKAFLELVQRSGLVERNPLKQALLACKGHHGGHLPLETDAVAEWLIKAGLLTRWQCDRLYERKHKGFFLGKYKLIEHLGTGGMSSVYLVEHTLLKRKRAMKILPKNRVGDTSYLARFQREAQATAALDHPNIVHAFDMDQDGDRHYLIMEYIQGRDLQSIVQQQGPLDYNLAANLITQAAEGLDYAHRRGLIHRDVKPANVLLNHHGVVKILDLGLALVSQDEQTSLTLMYNENVIGTADYLAPEQALNSHNVDARADVYGLGCTLYYTLTGHPPFPDGTIAQRIVCHQNETPASIQVDRPDCPPELAKICNRMMCKRPADRFSSCRDVANALERWLAQSGCLVGPHALDSADKIEILAHAATRLTTRWVSPTAERAADVAALMKSAASPSPAVPESTVDDDGPATAPSGLNSDLAATSAAETTSGSAVLVDQERPAPLPPIIEELLTASATADRADQTIVLSRLQVPRPARRTPGRRVRLWSWLAALGLAAICLFAGYWILLHLLANDDDATLHRISQPVRNVPVFPDRDI